MFRKTTGKLGEEYAASYLEKLGYRIVERNYRCRMGEIDIILRDGAVLVFVEVRTLRSLNYGLPQESINQRKVSKVRSVALQYVTRKNFNQAEIRFDVVAIQLTMDGCLAHIEYIKNAF